MALEQNGGGPKLPPRALGMVSATLILLFGGG